MSETATESVAAIPLESPKPTRGRKNRAPKTKQERHRKFVRLGAAVAVLAGAGALYGVWPEGAKTIPGTADEALLMKDQVKSQCLPAAAGKLLIHREALVYATPTVLPAGSHDNLVKNYVEKNMVNVVPNPVLVQRNGNSFYEFSTNVKDATGSTDTNSIGNTKAYVARNDHSVTFVPDTELGAKTLCTQFDDAGNFVLTKGGVTVGYTQPEAEAALPAADRLADTEMQVRHAETVVPAAG